MDKLNESNKSYNWDDINVGDYNMNHSENFFARAAIKEKVQNNDSNINWNKTLSLEDLREDIRKINVDTNIVKVEQLNDQEETQECDDNSQHNGCGNSREDEKREDENIEISILQIDAQDESAQISLNAETKCELNSLKKEIISPQEHLRVENERQSIGSDLKTEYVNRLESDEAEENRENDRHKYTPLNFGSDSPDHNQDENDENGAVKLRQNWSFYKAPDYNDGDNAVTAPKAYNYKDVYQNKREMALRQREEEERKARQFHSRPVPNFKALHKRLKDELIIHRVTVPITPETLKHSIASKQRKKRREHENEQLPADAKVSRKALIEMKPFQLRSEQRVRERREYDESVQNNLAQKKKEQEEERILRELEEIKEIRKMTEFKARPNPFNN